MERNSNHIESPATYASNLFATASARYPASVVAQGAAIALEHSGRTPYLESLGKALVANTAQMQHLETMARNAHRHNGVRVDQSKIARIIQSVFTVGGAMQRAWSPERIQSTIDRHELVRHDPYAVRELADATLAQLGLRPAS